MRISTNTLTPDSFKFPMTHSFSVSFARRIPFDMVLEAAYVGTRGRDLVTRVNGNVVPEGSLLTGSIGGSDLTNPMNRFALDGVAINARRPFQAYPGITNYDFEGESNYNSLQVTLSRQTSKKLQYFMTYTLSRTEGTLGDEYRNRDPFNPARTYGIRNEDRTHIFNLSWNAFLPGSDRASTERRRQGHRQRLAAVGHLDFASGIPIWLGFGGRRAPTTSNRPTTARTTSRSSPARAAAGEGLAPVYSCNPSLNGQKVGEKLLDINCIGFPASGQIGDVLPPYDIRTPGSHESRHHAVQELRDHGDQKLQVRIGVFNLFNMAAASTSVDRNDINLNLNTECNRVVNGVSNGVGGTVDNVCDVTGGFHFTQDTINNFGRINIRRGHRIVEFALKYYF